MFAPLGRGAGSACAATACGPRVCRPEAIAEAERAIDRSILWGVPLLARRGGALLGGLSKPL
jgi:hypothetical protein